MHRKETSVKKETFAERPVRVTTREDGGGSPSQGGGGPKGGALPVFSEDEPVVTKK